MHHYPLYIGRDSAENKTNSEIKEDLTSLVEKYEGKLVFGATLDQGVKGIRTINTYEILNQGAIVIQLSTQRNIQTVQGGDVNCLIACIGFNESSEFYNKLDKDIIGLCKGYSLNKEKKS